MSCCVNNQHRVWKGWIEIKLDRCLFFSSSFSTNLMIDIHILSCNFSTKDICQTIIHQTVMYVLRSGRLIGQFHFLFSISQYMDRSAENMVKKKKNILCSIQRWWWWWLLFTCIIWTAEYGALLVRFVSYHRHITSHHAQIRCLNWTT